MYLSGGKKNKVMCPRDRCFLYTS